MWGNSNLESLVGAPHIIFGNFRADLCALSTLKGGPSIVHGSFDVDGNPLTSLIGSPEYVGGYYSCQHTNITSLVGVPKKIGSNLFLNGLSQVKTLRGINSVNEMIGWVYIQYTAIESHILGVFFIKGCKGIVTDSAGNFGKAVEILNSHINRGKSGLLPCQKELIEAGLADFAQV
jgi:hypothetical protein